jgi:hypothetical protein
MCAAVAQRGIRPTHALWMAVDEPMTEFQDELGKLINRHSQENLSGTPDFVLAQFMSDCLSAFNAATNRREAWYGRGQDRFGMPT